MGLRVGTVNYACDSGLGLLTKAFIDGGVITDIVVVRHGRHETHDHWYPNAPQITNLKDRSQIDMAKRFCESMQVMFFIETPFAWELIPHCRGKGVKTLLCPMFECEFRELPYQPDAIVNPSLLDQQYYPNGTFIPVPVEVPWRQRTRAEVFLHNAGHGGLKGRNGTAEIIEAAKLLKSDAKIVIRMQEPNRQYWAGEQLRDAADTPKGLPKNVELRVGTLPYEELWKDGGEGDVFLFPEKFNGLSLPLQEARAAGMLVMCGARFPMTEWIPREPLIPVAGYRKNRIGPPYNQFDEAVFDPKDIAATIDRWYGQDITGYSLAGKAWAESMSWDALRPKYTQTLEALVS
jgi:hypothetical protein